MKDKDWSMEAYRYAVQRWGQTKEHTPTIKHNVVNGIHRVGVVSQGTFYCFGQGADWKKAIADAEEHKHNYRTEEPES